MTGGGPGGDVNYATAMQYNPRGQMIRETFGTNTALYQRKHYNRRGQLFDIRLGTDGSTAWDVEDPQAWQWANGSWNRGALRLFYSASLNDYSGPNPAQPLNNGNVHRMDHFVPNALSGDTITSWVMGVDEYLYDELNRLTRVTETPTGGTGSGFVQQFTYDRWGNRKIDTNATVNENVKVIHSEKLKLTRPSWSGVPSEAILNQTFSIRVRLRNGRFGRRKSYDHSGVLDGSQITFTSRHVYSRDCPPHGPLAQHCQAGSSRHYAA